VPLAIRPSMIISNFYPSVGGAEKQALLLAQELTRRGIRVMFITRRRTDTPHVEDVQGVPVLRVGRYAPGRFWSLLSALAWMVSLWRLRSSYDILHAHQPYSSALTAGLVGMLTGKPVVCKIPGEAEISALKGWRGLLLKQLITRFVVVNSQNLSEVEKLVGRNRVQMIPNGIHLDQASPENEVGERGPHILYVGRLEPVKNPDLLLNAFFHIRRRISTARLIFVGSGSQLTKLQQEAQEMGFGNSVSFVGEIGWQDVIGYYSRAGVLVNASWHEGISNSILEAMIHHVPVVASGIAGNMDLVRDGETGLLFQPRVPDDTQNMPTSTSARTMILKE